MKVYLYYINHFSPFWQQFSTHPGVYKRLKNFWPFRKIFLAFRLRFCYYIKAVHSANTSKEVLQKMAKCEFCDKGVTFGIAVSHSHRRTNRTWKPNVKRVKAIVDGSPKHVYACTRCLRSGKVTRAV
jgi:large subunit ribosomal protein L28